MDDDTDPISPSPAAAAARKIYSYSQPLGRDATHSRRSAVLRNKSLDEDLIVAQTAAVNAPRSYSYPHQSYHHSPPPSYHQHSNSVEDISSPHLPPPLPPHHLSSLGCIRQPSSLSGSDESLTLERAMSEFGGAAGSLPEFTGSSGDTGIFHVPARGPIHPARPPALELRPHPHRETQIGSFLRTIACTQSQLWAGQECGLRCWNLSHIFDSWGGVAPKRGDEECSPFRESCRTSPTLCLTVDAANCLIWSGHKDGKIRSWKTEQQREQPRNRKYSEWDGISKKNIAANRNVTGDAFPLFKEGLSWQAHRSPVLSLTITSYGDLWSGSEGGSIKAWPWESIDKSLSLTMEERHMAALLVERSYVDLRTQVTVGGVCSLPAVDIKYLLSDNSRSKVWSAGSLSFALWDARSKELLKVFGIDGQIETKVDTSSIQDPCREDEMKVKLVSTSKKEKSQGSGNFFQRSRNALMGAADAVRRAASKGTFGEDNRRTEALALAADGMIWTGCTNGSLVQWDGNGNRLQEFHHHSHSVQCISAFGTRLWVGYAGGTIQVLDLEGNLLGGWVAHSSPVMKMAVGGSYIFSLANHGGIRGWSLTYPGPLDSILRNELASKVLLYTKLERLKMLVGTWNVGQERASHDSLISWLGSAASEVGLVVVGLQEVEMGAGFLAMAAAKETVGLEGSANGQWWLDAIGKTLDEGGSFEHVGSRQLAGLLISAWARKKLRPHIGDVDAAAVACGFGRAIGNKGAVGLRMRIYDRIFCFASCHFAAHLEAVSRRNADFDHVYRTLSFTRPSNVTHAAPAGASSAIQPHRIANLSCRKYFVLMRLHLAWNVEQSVPEIFVAEKSVSRTSETAAVSNSDDGRPELSEADMIVFIGDFNYRLHGISYDEARDMVSQRCFDWLRDKDQLRAEMKAGKVFQGMREGQIKFPPTYKFERHTAGLAGYDSSEKKRIPAWCDRILYRDSRSISVAECSLECPVVSSISQYEACMDVNDSDHKPVRCIFNVEVAHADKLIRRQEFGETIENNGKIRSLLEEYSNVPETIISTNDIILQNQDTSILRITNKCDKYKASFQIICEGQSTVKEDGNASEFWPRCSFGFPRWLQVPDVKSEGLLYHLSYYRRGDVRCSFEEELHPSNVYAMKLYSGPSSYSDLKFTYIMVQPAAGIIKPGQIIEVTVHHEDFYTQEEFMDGIPQNWWCEDTRDKEVVLIVNIMGSYSTEKRSHCIHVRHCYSAQTTFNKSKGNSRRPPQSNHRHRSDIEPFSKSSDVMHEFCHMRCP